MVKLDNNIMSVKNCKEQIHHCETFFITVAIDLNFTEYVSDLFFLYVYKKIFKKLIP